MNDARIELTVRYGDFGHKVKTAVLQVSEGLITDLMEPLELSDEPFSLMVASPGMSGGRGNAVTIRRKTFEMRRSTAEQIARAMIPKLMEVFGVNDKIDGYAQDELDPEQVARHKRRHGL